MKTTTRLGGFVAIVLVGGATIAAAFPSVAARTHAPAVAPGLVSRATVSQLPAVTSAGDSAWTRVYDVLSHPRCANCHVGSDNRPMWSGPSYVTASSATPRPHGMNVRGGVSRSGAEVGLPCSSCHASANSLLPHGPPGVEGWVLAPVHMQWFGKSSAEICVQLKDPARNGGRTLAKIASHIEDDPLVRWGWSPGPGREPAPYTPEASAADVRVWAAAGAPCPSEGASAPASR